MFKTSEHDFGSIAKGAKAEFEFSFKNLYVEDVRVASAVSSCGCTSVSIKDNKRVLKTHETGAIVASINSSTFIGSKGATITVRFDPPFWGEVQLHVRSNVRGDFVLQPGSAAFGVIDQGTAALKTIEASSPGNPNLRIVEVRSSNPHLSAKIIDRGRSWQQAQYQVQVRIDETAPPGYIHDHVMLVTNDYRSGQVPLLVEGQVRPAISISPEALFMGVLKPGERASKNVVIRAKEPFVIKKITAPGEGFEFDTSGEQAPKAVHVIPVTFVAGDEPGKVVQAIQIETDRNMKGELVAQVFVAGPDGKVPDAPASREPAKLETGEAAAPLASPQRRDPAAAAAPALVRPQVDDLPDRPILSRSAFRDRTRQQRYEELLRRNGPSPSSGGR